jgi:hypothetical protein
MPGDYKMLEKHLDRSWEEGVEKQEEAAREEAGQGAAGREETKGTGLAGQEKQEKQEKHEGHEVPKIRLKHRIFRIATAPGGQEGCVEGCVEEGGGKEGGGAEGKGAEGKGAEGQVNPSSHDRPLGVNPSSPSSHDPLGGAGVGKVTPAKHGLGNTPVKGAKGRDEGGDEGQDEGGTGDWAAVTDAAVNRRFDVSFRDVLVPYLANAGLRALWTGRNVNAYSHDTTGGTAYSSHDATGTTVHDTTGGAAPPPQLIPPSFMGTAGREYTLFFRYIVYCTHAHAVLILYPYCEYTLFFRYTHCTHTAHTLHKLHALHTLLLRIHALLQRLYQTV